MCRPFATMPTNWSYMSMTSPCSTSLPCGVNGLVKLGWSFNGPEVIASVLDTDRLQQPGHLAGLSRTPIEPVSVPSRAKIRAAGTATM